MAAYDSSLNSKGDSSKLSSVSLWLAKAEAKEKREVAPSYTILCICLVCLKAIWLIIILENICGSCSVVYY